MTRRTTFPFNPTRLFGSVLLVAALGSAASLALADGPRGHHGGRGDHSMGMPMHGRMVDRMLDTVKATPDQRAQIKQITDSAAVDAKAQRETSRALRAQSMALFTQPVIDARAAEALRVQMLQQHDKASSRRLQTMLEVSRVLTPEQRKLLADRAAQRRDMKQRHMQERQSLQGAPAQR